MSNKHKHMEFIQAVVNRLSHNSFLLKGWSVVLVSALFALSASGSNMAFLFLAYIPVLVFWGLDGYFLREEKKFRALYDHVRKLDDAEIDFSMNTSKVSQDVPNWRTCIFSKTLVPFHGVLFAAIIFVMLVKL